MIYLYNYRTFYIGLHNSLLFIIMNIEENNELSYVLRCVCVCIYTSPNQNIDRCVGGRAHITDNIIGHGHMVIN